MRIGTRDVGGGLPPLLLASSGASHGGDVQIGYKLVETAGARGAQCVVLGRGQLGERDFKSVLGHAGHVGLLAVGAPASLEDLALFEAMDVPAIRIEEAEHSPFLSAAARNGRPLVLSLADPGFSAAEDVIERCRTSGVRDFALLTADPRMMEAWQARWPKVPFGLLGRGLTPDELRTSHAALIETEHRLPASGVAWRNRP